jgi:predicted glycogen debranching enzyme
LRIQFGPAICRDLAAATQREWLETNGLGGFASSTIAGLNTRRYHGLLVAATQPPAGRMVLLSKLEETLIVGGTRFELSANQYPGVVHPAGYQYLEEFRLDPFPTFTYRVEGLQLQKRLFLVHGENTLVVQYSVDSPDAECLLELRPLIAFRDFHSLTHRNDALNPLVTIGHGLASIAPYPGLPPLHLAHNAETIDPTGDWYHNFEYAAERERGLDFEEDLFQPMTMRFRLGSPATVIASTEVRNVSGGESFRESEIERRSKIVSAAPRPNLLMESLSAAADQFIVRREDGTSIIAGYHWFGDWGRDTMISLPGLTLVTGRSDAARCILLAFRDYIRQGMVPNWFPDAGETPGYNTVDATLWYFEAVRAFLGYTRDFVFVKEQLYDALKDIVDWHVRGTGYGIHVDEDGLLLCGDPTTQLTWMDARVDGRPVTSRHGKPVEIQALWYNALCTMEGLATEFGEQDAAHEFGGMAVGASASFNQLFWNAESACLYDVVRKGDRDASIRPNQIFAVSLRHSMLSNDRARAVVAVVQNELLTPMGLRTLAPGDPSYHPRCEGGVAERDSAYHQGTVWPWLMGPFLTAYLNANQRSAFSRERAADWLTPFIEHLNIAGLGNISEIADGDAPHQPRGCIAQAWSVAELLRAAVEDVYG